MCLYCEKKKPIKCRTNLTCYKVLKVRYGLERKQDEFFSPLQNVSVPKKGDGIEGTVFEAVYNAHNEPYHCLQGTLATTPVQRILHNIPCISEGFIHTFRSLKDAEESITIADYFLKLKSYDCEGYEIFECVIPKGTEYYRGTHSIGGYEGFASKKIKFIKSVK